MLPIEEIHDSVVAAWRQGGAIIGAPPGSGKTTQLPLWLLEDPGSEVFLLIPKRLAVTLAARQLAANLNESVGQRIGYQLRKDAKTSRQTQLTVTTYGTFLRLLINDPDRIAGCTIIFDEFHERSADQDLTYALVNQYVELFDASVRRIIMSATLNVELIAQQTNLPVIESQGRSFPVSVSYTKTDTQRPDQVAALIQRYHHETNDHMLVFCPGLREIRAIERHLSVPTLILHGTLDATPDLTDLNSAPATVILATNIAESSITLPRVHTVVDLGTERYAQSHPVTGITELKTRRISQASATQRAGRAGRLGPGKAIRLWSDDEQQSLIPHQTPPIRETDLSSLVLLVAGWGTTYNDLTWLEPPPLKRWQIAQEKLREWQALTADADLTEHGQAMLTLGLDPWLAHLLAMARDNDQVTAACLLAAHIIGGQNITYDLFVPQKLNRFPKDVQREVSRLTQRVNQKPEQTIEPMSDEFLARVMADRIMRLTDRQKGQLISGTAVRLMTPCKANWALLLDGIRKDGQIQCFDYIPVSAKAVFKANPPTETVLYQPNAKPAFLQILRIGRIELEQRPCQPDPELKQTAWLSHIDDEGEKALPWSDDTLAIRKRWKVAEACVEDWPVWPGHADWGGLVAPFLTGISRLEALDLSAVLKHALGYEHESQLERLFPKFWQAPSGRKVLLSYQPEKSTAVAVVKLQEIFGLEQTPTLAGGKQPIQLDLQAPNGRSVASVTDLAHFWAQIYPEVRKELRGRYNKHPWPEDPLNAEATTKTNRQIRQNSD